MPDGFVEDGDAYRLKGLKDSAQSTQGRPRIRLFEQVLENGQQVSRLEDRPLEVVLRVDHLELVIRYGRLSVFRVEESEESSSLGTELSAELTPGEVEGMGDGH